MPKVKPLTSRPEWEESMLKELAVAQILTGMSIKQICRQAGLTYETFRGHVKNPYMMRFGEYHTFLEACERLRGG